MKKNNNFDDIKTLSYIQDNSQEEDIKNIREKLEREKLEQEILKLEKENIIYIINKTDLKDNPPKQTRERINEMNNYIDNEINKNNERIKKIKEQLKQITGGFKISKKVIKELVENKFRKNLRKSSIIINGYKVSYDNSKIKMKKDEDDNRLVLTNYRQILVIDKKRNVINLSKPLKYSKDLLNKKYNSKKVSLNLYKDQIKFPKFEIEKL